MPAFADATIGKLPQSLGTIDAKTHLTRLLERVAKGEMTDRFALDGSVTLAWLFHDEQDPHIATLDWPCRSNVAQFG